MIHRKLKHYEEWLDRIEKYTKASGIKIERTSSEEGVYIPTRNKICISPDLSESYEIAVLLHELGHAFDIGIVDKKINNKVELAYGAVYSGGKCTPGQLKLVLACEERAWDTGKVIAKNLRIKLGKWYDDARDRNIRGYKK